MLQEPIIIDDMSLEIEVTIGIALSPDHGSDAHTLLKHASIAVRSAKNDGFAIRTYSFKSNPFTLRTLKLHGELRQAIKERTLSLFYQSQVDLNLDRIISVEALARWIHPIEGMIAPDDFIPIIEQTGLIYLFTQWVLEEAITQLKNWADKGIFLEMAVNISARNLLEADLAEKIGKLLDFYQVDAKYLCIEITESSLMRDPEKALGLLNELHEMGIKLSIDDFGTGYSSLAYLQKLPMDELKIDQAFIFNLCKNKGDAVIVQSTIGLAHSLGLKVIAEGIESREVMEKLKQFKCDSGQGYYMSRPLPLNELELWLKESQWGLKSEQ
jgi:EAL domain-containing protein (putative c-di-GMP-specific phosphodiesterase class I)